MTNPYEPPPRDTVQQREIVAESIRPSTPLQRLRNLVFFAAGCTLGMHAGVAIEDGIAAAFDRTSSGPWSALVFFTAVSVVCIGLSSLWKLVRRQISGDYVATAGARFASGTLLTAAFYLIMSKLDQAKWVSPGGAIWWAQLVCVLIIVTACAVEFEAGWTRMRTRAAEGDR